MFEARALAAAMHRRLALIEIGALLWVQGSPRRSRLWRWRRPPVPGLGRMVTAKRRNRISVLPAESWLGAGASAPSQAPAVPRIHGDEPAEGKRKADVEVCSAHLPYLLCPGHPLSLKPATLAAILTGQRCGITFWYYHAEANMRITTKGQVTIPQGVRDFAGFTPGTEVEFVIGDDGVVRVVAAGQGGRQRLAAAIAGLQGSADGDMSTDQIMALTRE
jgi:AbrB family looped-hinge helix DNA binding protein